MACRLGIHRILARSRDARKIFSSVLKNSVNPFPFPYRSVVAPAVQSMISNDIRKGPTCKDQYEDLSSHFANLRDCSGALKGVSSHDSDEQGDRSRRLSHGNWDRSLNSMKMRSMPEERKTEHHYTIQHLVGISSAQIAKPAAGGFSALTFGRFSWASGSGGSHRVWRGYMIRSFSSAPAEVKSTEIPVEGEQLEFLQGAIDTASGVASLPSPAIVSEVSLAAADSSLPVAFVQYCIDGVHCTTGLPWWASIVATTVAIRIMVLPIIVYQMKATARLTLMRPELEKLTNKIKDSGYDPKVVEDNQMRMKALFQKYKTTPFSPILGAFVQAPIFMCFFFGIRNMADKMESFKEGGALWFTDLSTPDSLFILPVLSGAFFLLTVELGAADGMEGQPVMAKMKMFLRGLAVILVPLTASFPKALFCYWLTANVFSIMQAAAFKVPAVKASLGIPDVSHLAKPADVPVAPVLTFSQPPRLKGESKTERSKHHRS